MRVIAGTARGRKLIEPMGYDVRPTTDKVKESMFNIIQFDLENARVLDLFAGTGQLGIEALSRGAKEVVFIDASQKSLKVVRENLKITDFQNEGRVVCSDAESYLRSGEKFDVVLIDPPYDSDLAARCLTAVNEFDILNENGIILCETRTGAELPNLGDGFAVKEYRYGKILLTVFRKS